MAKYEQRGGSGLAEQNWEDILCVRGWHKSLKIGWWKQTKKALKLVPLVCVWQGAGYAGRGGRQGPLV